MSKCSTQRSPTVADARALARRLRQRPTHHCPGERHHLLTFSTSAHHQGVYWLYRVATERRIVMATEESDYRLHGVRIVHANELDPNTAQTPGMNRAAAINAARAGAEKLWAGTVVIHPDAKTGPHHHGHLESVIYVVAGPARMRWGNHLEFTAEAGPGDFIYVS